ncbi:uncharacterized protein LOC128962404 [Oppia nitens]|uniref:uncharacterized protein LOC128962404 n=1 Tax=Oppia nitens TaxID=1686743 RepID=UPI0023DBC358|nr:uncharacterized protein LOC128962404 [Oppia nitens]
MAAGLYDITPQTLGKGHFAVVKLAKHCLTGESVAIKIIDKVKLNKEGLQQLGIEIRLWSRLSEHEHQNVVKLYQVIDTRTKLYLVMEYCGQDVCDLYDHIQRRNHGNGLKEVEAKHIFRQICCAISYCHSLQIVHRDLKPENILIIAQPLEQNNTRIKYPLVKLIDFGFSNQWAEGEMLRTSCGSLAYSAPEILLGDRYNGPKVDIWGLGCILYILLYGSNPFMQINDSETLCRILDCNFSTPVRPYISESAIELIKSLLKRDPDNRLTIEEIVTHPWLNDSDEFSFDDIKYLSKLPIVPKNVKNSVHNRVIDQMVTKGVGNSKEHIEKVLENVLLEDQPNNSLKDKTNGGCDSVNTQSGVNHEHYIKATYQLLKDKSMREFHGLHQNNNSVNQNTSGHLTKRLLPLKPRKHLIQQISKNTKPFQEEESEDDNPISFSAGINQLDLPNDDGSGLVLPLQRKCSIVSEEGSCAAEGSDLSSFEGPINDRISLNEHKPVLPTINIVVTDCSQADESQTDEDEVLNSELGQIGDINMESTVNTNFSNEPSIYNPIVTTTVSTLHSVSSSPELLRNNDEDDNDFDVSHSGRGPKGTAMILLNETKHDKQTDHLISHFGQNVSTNNSSINNSSSPSMRIIVQSKSCNNILFNENDSFNSSINDKSDIKSVNSVSIKRHKTDRNDCCIIC